MSMSKNVINLPNLLTLFRFPAALAMLWLLQQYTSQAPAGGYPVWIAVGITIVSVLTFFSDLLDGKIARAYKIVTNFGKVMDPVADSIFFTLLLMGLAVSPRFEVSIWFTVIMLYREAGVQVMRRFAAYQGVVLMAGWSGKLKMFLQCVVMAALGLTLLASDTGLHVVSEAFLKSFAWWSSLVTAVAGLLSFGVYIKQLPQMMRDHKDV